MSNLEIMDLGVLNSDGRISLVDLSKYIAHYAEIPGFTLYGAWEKSGEINFEGNITLVDVSKLLVTFNNM